jgi:hypothetical protein
MVAKGLAPGLGSEHLVTALYQLTFDSSSQVAADAKKSLGDLPDNVLEGTVDKEIHPLVLDMTAKLVVGRPKLIEAILLNSAVADETLVDITPKLGEKQLEILAKNERRLLRHPQLIEKLYVNPNTRMSTANRCVELAVRNNVELKLPAYKEIAKAIGMSPVEEDPIDRALAEEESNVKFASVYSHTKDRRAEDAEAEEGEGEAEEDEEGGEGGRGGGARTRVEQLSVPEKIRLATMGNVFHRTVLLRDSNKLVAMAAIKSPLVTEIEVARASKNPSTPEDVLRYIGRQREWLKLYQVKSNLVSNAKTPLSVSLKLVSHLRKKELRALSRSKNVAAALRNAAQARLKKKS